MRNRWGLLCGGASILGGVLSIVANVPSTWYGLEPPDSYVFDPAVLSPLWIDRLVIPALSIVAALGLLVGLIGLIKRDWPVATRIRRWGGIGGIIGLAGVMISLPAFLFSFRETGVIIILTLASLAIGGIGLLLFVLSLIALAYGYLHTNRPYIGYVFAAVLVTVPILGYVVSGPTQSLAAALPIGIGWTILGVELAQNPEPLGSPEGQR